MATIFSIIISTHLQNDLYVFEINSLDIFYSSSIAVVSKPIFRWEDAFVLFSKMSDIA